jgi:hypothetical protein
MKAAVFILLPVFVAENIYGYSSIVIETAHMPQYDVELHDDYCMLIGSERGLISENILTFAWTE